MKTKKLLFVIASIFLIGGIVSSFPIMSKCSENTGSEGKVYAIVFYGRYWGEAYSTAQRFHSSLLQNKLPGYKTEKENIRLAGKLDGLLVTDKKTTMDSVNQMIHEPFSKSTDNDMLILYYAGHNVKEGTGLYFGENEGFLYPFYDLLIKLKQYSFKKLVIVVDACYAGKIKDDIASCDDESFKNKLYVLTSTGSNLNNENNEEGFFSFTKGILSTSGAESIEELMLSKPSDLSQKDRVLSIRCDKNNDGIISTREAYEGGKASPGEYSWLSLFWPFLGNNEYHNPYYYPDNDTNNCPLFQFQYLDIDKSTLEIYEGNEYSKQLTATKHYVMTDQHTIRWTSEDNTIAVVDDDGKVTGLKDGKTTITARLYTNEGVECLGAEAACEVTVKKVTTDIDQDNTFVYVGQEVTVEYTVEGPEKKCVWDSSDESIATVKNGTIKGIKPGITTVSLRANNKSDSIQVMVMEPFIEADDMTMLEGESTQIQYKIYGPKGDITFSSSDKAVASVDKAGIITAHKAGKAKITLKANNVTTTIEVTVEKLNLTMESIGLAYGHYEGVKPQGDGAIPTQLDLYEDGTFCLHCSFDLFSPNSTEHTYTGTYMVDRINEDGYPVLLFHSDTHDFEMIYTGKILDHENFFLWTD